MLLELFFFKNNNIIKNKIENIQLINYNKYLIMNRKQYFNKLINQLKNFSIKTKNLIFPNIKKFFSFIKKLQINLRLLNKKSLNLLKN